MKYNHSNMNIGYMKVGLERVSPRERVQWGCLSPKMEQQTAAWVEPVPDMIIADSVKQKNLGKFSCPDS